MSKHRGSLRYGGDRLSTGLFLVLAAVTAVLVWFPNGMPSGSITQQQGASDHHLTIPIIVNSNSTSTSTACPTVVAPDGVGVWSKTHAEFQEALTHFNWRPYTELARLRQHPTDDHMRPLLSFFEPFIMAEPAHPIEVSSRPQPLSQSLQCSREEYSGTLTGRKRDPDEVPKVFDFFLFSIELELLEIRLFELDEAVDYFVLAESTLTHRGHHKRLFYNETKHTRFARFQHKIIHLVLDDDVLQPYISLETSANYRVNEAERRALWTEFVKQFGEENIGKDDIVMYSDVDEIASGKSVYHMKYCEAKGMPVSQIIAFHNINLQWLQVSAWPWTDSTDQRPKLPSDFPYTLRFPEYFAASNMSELGFKEGKRRTGNIANLWLPRGCHMTLYGQPWLVAYKDFSQAHYSTLNPFIVNFLSRHDLVGFVKTIEAGNAHNRWPKDVHHVSTVSKKQHGKFALVPWVAQHNPLRFATLLGPGGLNKLRELVDESAFE